MKLSSKLVGALLLILFSAVSQAQNYYICDTGDDANLGKSEAKPFKTHTKAMEVFNKMSAGDSILYCRGGTFNADTFTRISNSKCRADKVCTIADYGSEKLAKPIIYSDGQTPFNFQNGGDSRPDGGYVLKNIDLIGENRGNGIMLYNEVNDLVVDNLHIEGFVIGFYAAGANKAASGNRANNRLVLKNSTIINNRKQGWLGGCNDCLIENNHFEGNGTEAVFDHNIYIESPIKEQSFYNEGITIRGNTLTKSAYVNEKCSGVSLVAHGILKDLVIENNYIKEYLGKVTEHCWGIGIDPGNNLDESFIGLRISNNKLVNVGNTGIGCASCVNVLIKNNTIIDEGEVLRSGIAVPNKKSEDSVKSNNVIIENNKIILNHELGYGINLSGSNQFVVRNNDISTNKLKSRSRCFMLTDGNSDNDTSDNTCGNHTTVSIIDPDVSQPPEEQQDDSLPSDVVDKEQEETLPVHPGENTNTVEMDLDATDEPDSQTVEPGFVNDAVSENAQTPEIDRPSGNLSGGTFEVTVDNSDFQTVESAPANNALYGREQTSEMVQSSDDLTSNTGENSIASSDGVKPRKAASNGGSSSGGGASSKSSRNSSSNMSSLDEMTDISDNIAFFETSPPVKNSLNISTSTETMFQESETIQNSSPSITKMKDVLQASQEDLSNIDSTQCRASANGKCLMK